MEQNKRTLYILLAIIALAVVVRVTLVAINGHYMFLGSLAAPDNDDVKYIRSGAVLLQQHILVYRDTNEATVFIGPVLPAAIAMVFSIFGTGMKGILAFQIFQALIGALSVFMIFLLGKEIFSPRVGLLAALIYAVEPTAVWNCGFVLTETIFTFLLLLVAFLTWRALKTKSLLHFALLGACWALASMLKSAIGLYFGMVLIAMLIYKFSPKDIVKYSLITCLAFAVVMSPWWIRNYARFHRFIPFTASSGNPMIQGTFFHNQVEMKQLVYENSPTEIGQNDIEMKVAKDRIAHVFRRNFLKYVYWYTIGKVIYLWRDPFFWTPRGGYMPPIIPYVMFLLHYLTLGLGIAGAIAAIRNNFRAMVVPIGVISYFTLVHLPFFVMSRYSFPLMPLVLLMAAYLLVNLWDNRRSKHPAHKAKQPQGAL